MCLGPSFPQVTRGDVVAHGEATRAESVSQLGSPSLLSLIRPWPCQSPPEVSSSGVSCRVAWPLKCSLSGNSGASSLVGMPGTLRALADVSPSRYSSESGETFGDYMWQRVTVSFMLQKDHVGVGCETHRGDRELCQGLMEEPGSRSGLGQGCGCRGELV